MTAVRLNPLQHFARFRRHLAIEPVRKQFGVAEHGVQRRAEFMAHISEELRLVLACDREFASLLGDLVKEKRVVEREHGLRRKRLHEIDGGKVARLAAQEHQGAENSVLAHERRDQRRAKAGGEHRRLMRKVRVGGEIGGEDDLPPIGPRKTIRIERILCGFSRRESGSFEPARMSELHGAASAIEAVDRARLGAGERHGARHDRRHHRVGVERRGDRAADLLHGLQLAVGFREIARPLRDHLFEPLVGPLHMRGHRIELARQILDLVGGPHVDAVAEVAGGEPPRARLQRLDRRDEAARQQHAGGGGENHAEEQQPDGAIDQAVDRRRERRCAAARRRRANRARRRRPQRSTPAFRRRPRPRTRVRAPRTARRPGAVQTGSSLAADQGPPERASAPRDRRYSRWRRRRPRPR